MRFFIVSLVALLAACTGGKKKNDNSPQDNPGEDKPSGIPDDANPFDIPKDDGKFSTATKVGDLKDLPENYVAELRAWLLKPKKSCDISAIFSEAKRPEAPLEESYDLTMLLKAMDQKLWLTNNAGEVLLLSQPRRPGKTGFGNRTITRNGASIHMSHNLSFDGMCTITVNDKLVASLPLTSGFGVSALLKAGALDEIKADNVAESPTKGQLSILNLSPLEVIEDNFRFDRASQLKQFTIPGYEVESLVTWTYNVSPHSILFRQGEQVYRGWFEPRGELSNFLAPIRPSWSDSSAMPFVPTVIESKKLADMQRQVALNEPVTPIPLEWTLEFAAWESNPERGTWKARPAQVNVSASLVHYDFNAGLQRAQIALRSVTIAAPQFSTVPENDIAQCIESQTNVWLNALAAGRVHPPIWTMFPCERLAAHDKPLIIADLYAADEGIRRSIDQVLTRIPVDASADWDLFDLSIARKIGKDSFPFAAATPLFVRWKIFFDRYAPKYKFEQAIELSSRIAHGCDGTYTDGNLQTFETEYLKLSKEYEKMELVSALRATCRRN